MKRGKRARKDRPRKRNRGKGKTKSVGQCIVEGLEEVSNKKP